MNASCSDCVYFQRTNLSAGQHREFDRGLCKRFPPAPDANEAAVFPMIVGGNWCGEFKPDFDRIRQNLVTRIFRVVLPCPAHA